MPTVSTTFSISRAFTLGLIVLLSMSSVWGQQDPSYLTAREGRIFKIFQFSHNQIPRIDGQVDDWSTVPTSYTYGTDELNDTEDGMGTDINPNDLDVEVTLGWVKGLNRIYFKYKAFDDYWDFGRFNNKGYQNDIFEIVVDGDLSGGPFIFNPMYDKEEMKWASTTPSYLENHFSFSGVHAQNYHIYTPPVNNAWSLVWGCQHWIAEFPQANYAYNYNFSPGDSGTLILEGWITPYDYAPYEGPKRAIESTLEENKIIGFSWSILDFDGSKREGHVNLAHNVQMVKDATYLCAFKLMPPESRGQNELKANWTFEVIDMNRGTVAFKDQSEGVIDKWHWDFGNGDTSQEQNPIYTFPQKGVHKVVTLTVEGAKGVSKKTRYWQVMLK